MSAESDIEYIYVPGGSSSLHLQLKHASGVQRGPERSFQIGRCDFVLTTSIRICPCHTVRCDFEDSFDLYSFGIILVNVERDGNVLGERERERQKSSTSFSTDLCVLIETSTELKKIHFFCSRDKLNNVTDEERERHGEIPKFSFFRKTSETFRILESLHIKNPSITFSTQRYEQELKISFFEEKLNILTDVRERERERTTSRDGNVGNFRIENFQSLPYILLNMYG